MRSRNVFTVLQETAAQCGDAPALCQPTSEGGVRRHRVYSWREYQRAAEEIAAGLRRLGIAKGEIVALDSETRAELYLADIGIMTNGSIAAALYTSYAIADRARTIRACDARAVFVESPRTLRGLKQAADPALPLRWILLTGSAEGALTLDELRAQGRQALDEDPGLMDRIQAEVAPSDPAILYLTSGATGEPKMGLASHAALVANMDMGPDVLQLGPEDCTLAFLPSAHITQRVVIELLPIRSGVPVWFAESLMKLPQELETVKPTLFVAPPRLWERVYASVTTEVRRRPLPARKLFDAALALGRKAARLRQQGKRPGLWLRFALAPADRLVFRKIRARLGGRVRVCASGSAPLGKELAEFYMAVGLPLVEGYGLTEGGILVLNPLERPKAGSIGKVLPGVEARVAEDGELLFRSATLFAGYHKDPQATAQVLRHGWLYTGDIAEIDNEGYIYITGRKKELIVTSSGRKIYPARIESLFRMEPIVSNVLLVGDRRPYMTALVTVNATVADALKAPVDEEIKKAVDRVNRHLAPFEQIRKFRVLERDFSIEHGELTATLKVRRSRALENFREAISDLYAGRDELH